MAEIKITYKEKEFLKRKQEIIFDDNKCYVETPIYPDSVKRELVMTKNVFIQCYNKWIKENKDGSNTRCAKCRYYDNSKKIDIDGQIYNFCSKSTPYLQQHVKADDWCDEYCNASWIGEN